jgi:ATP-dependent exoDNAse (exonuclease V) beta subunit
MQGCDKMNKILKASAGTGKTYRLSLEYINAVLDGTDYKNIVVMTFTRKATAEIRERIIEHLKDLKENKFDSEVYHNLKEMRNGVNNNILTNIDDIYNEILINKDQINVHTIDSFVNKIFKRSIAPYLGIRNYEVTDKDNESAEKVFKKVLKDDKAFNLMEDFLSENASRKIQSYIDIISDILDQRWKFELIDYQDRTKSKNTDYTKRLDNCLEILKDIAQKKNNEFGLDHFNSSYRETLDIYLTLDDKKQKESIIYNDYSKFLDAHFWNGNKTGGKDVAELKNSLEIEYEYMQEALANKVFNKEIIPYERQVFSFIDTVFNFYDRIKLKERVFTYSDISNYTYHFLNKDQLNLINNQQITDYFKELIDVDIQYLLIDEFQDTSVLQWKIIKPIIDSLKNAIIVGDEKQSIYGWRGGEKELFSNLEEIISGNVVNLDTCYRSNERILDFINNFFKDVHPEWVYRNVKTLDSKKNKGYLYLLLGGSRSIISTDTKTFRKKSEEKQQAIKKINELVKTDLKKEIAKKIADNKDMLSDIAVLARKNDDLKEIAEELDARGIKYILGSSNSIIEHEAVKPIYYILNYLYSNDYLSLLKFSRSDLIGINHKTLKYLLRYKKDVEKAIESKVETKLNGVNDIVSKIKELKEMDYNILIHHLFNEMGLFDIYKEQADTLKNLYYFYEIVNKFNSISSLMEYIGENKESEKLQQVGIEDGEAVNLTTIHRSKGLTFKSEFFYFYPKISGGGGSNNIKIYIDFDDNYDEVEDYLLTNTRYNKILESLSFNFIEEERHKELMEEINNTYVAITRAANNLFIYVENPRKLKLGNKLCWKGSKYEFYETSLLNASNSSDLKDLIAGKEFGGLVKSEAKSINRSIDLTGIAKYFKADIDNPIDDGVILDYQINKKRLMGTIAHDYLEYIIYDNEKEHRLARDIIMDKYVNIVGADEIEYIITAVKEFIEGNKPLFEVKYDVFNEYTLYDGDEMKRIDRLMVDEDAKKIKILDYKTGEHYEEKQLDEYAEVLTNKLDEDYNIETEFLNIEL